MRRSALKRLLYRARLAFLGLIFLSSPALAGASGQQPQLPASTREQKASPVIVVAFIGGFHDRKVRGYAELNDRLRNQYGDRIRIKTVFNGRRDKKKADRAVRGWLDTDGDGQLSEAEKSSARIVLYGHSWGAQAAIAFAKRLQRQQIPVLLLAEIDSVPKPGEDSHTVPENVAEAINFYQPRGLLHGLPNLVAAAPEHTRILGNIEISYDPNQPPCRDYDFLIRGLDKYHVAIECDPRVWSRIEMLINESLLAKPGVPAASDPN